MVRTLALIAGIGVIIWMVLGITPVPRSHADAITLVLHEHNVPVRSVTVTQLWPNALPFYAYGKEAMPYQAVVTVALVTEHQIKGFLVCADAPYACRMTFRDLKIISEPIPDISPSSSFFERVYAIIRRLSII
ncbi:MAG: hypothetical protein FJ040_09945 [Chloroflexi bacterium]|nr:hypothetical protein [Chloroflexota bacterium]